MPAPYRAIVLTISDSVSQGTREDLSGPAVKAKLEEAGWSLRGIEVLPDDFNLIRERLTALSAETDIDAIFTTGGTGVGPRDRTPEATTSVMERSLPGVAELMRREGLKQTPLAALSRAVAGVRSKTLLINLPGSPDGAVGSLVPLLEILPHAVDLVRGETAHAAPEPSPQAPPEAPAAEEEPVTPERAESEPAAEEGLPEGEPLGNSESV
ncbi:MAG: MogA/MoaB family molybdenum cofactor biosynthesis protein [Acidobacteria bacterium]|nr:MogA/MoaB family molybdenum cofactor biosynthesis protein [Acidobacteriota bacterium]